MSYEVVIEADKENELGKEVYLDLIKEIIRKCLSEVDVDEKGNHISSRIN